MANGYVKSMSTDPCVMTAQRAATVGRITGYTRASAYGHTPTPTANSDVWEGAGLYPFQSTAVKLEALSASASDTAAGTGARTVMVQGLDANFNSISETVTMNGVTPVTTVNNYIRVNGFNLLTAGSGNTNAGDITLRVSGAGATQAIMRAGYGYSKSAIYTVPTGFTLLVTDLLFNVAGNGNAVNITYSFTRVGPTGLIITTNEYNSNPSAPLERTPQMGGPVAAQTTLTLRITAIGGVPTGGFASFEGYLIDNTQLT